MARPRAQDPAGQGGRSSSGFPIPSPWSPVFTGTGSPPVPLLHTLLPHQVDTAICRECWRKRFWEGRCSKAPRDLLRAGRGGDSSPPNAKCAPQPSTCRVPTVCRLQGSPPARQGVNAPTYISEPCAQNVYQGLERAVQHSSPLATRGY